MKPLIVLEMANNHMGDVNHGLKIIDSFTSVREKYKKFFKFAFKFQYRDLETYIHSSDKGNHNLGFVKRFEDTRINENDFQKMRKHFKSNNFLSICTPFDSISAQKVIKEKFDIIKIASACIDDWDIHETISKYKATYLKKKFKELDLIFSTGGAVVNQVDRLASFYNKRNFKLGILHCIATYPSPTETLQLNKIDYFHKRYPFANIGYSTHEPPNEIRTGSLAYSLGARIFEKHVALETKKYPKNKYSVSSYELDAWLDNLLFGISSLGLKDEFSNPSNSEIKTVNNLKRGVHIEKSVKEHQILKNSSLRYSFPKIKNQLTPGHLNMFTESLTFKKNLEKNERLTFKDVILNQKDDSSQIISEYIHIAKGILRSAGITYNINVKDVELSHHFGVKNLFKVGALLITRINNEVYSKKLVILSPGQSHPKHYHKLKDETFEVLHGDLTLFVDKKKYILKPGDTVRVRKKQIHNFKSKNGVVFEEIANQAKKNDSFYIDDVNKNRKTISKLFWNIF